MLNKQRLKNIVLAVFAVLFLLVLYTNFSDRPSIFSLINNRFLADHGGAHVATVLTANISDTPINEGVTLSVDCSGPLVFNILFKDLDGSVDKTITDATPGPPILSISEGASPDPLTPIRDCVGGSGVGGIPGQVESAYTINMLSCDLTGKDRDGNVGGLMEDGIYTVVLNNETVKFESLPESSNQGSNTYTFTCGASATVDPDPPCEDCGNTGTQLDMATVAWRIFDNVDRDENKDEVGPSHGETNEPFSCAQPGIPFKVRDLIHVFAGELEVNGRNPWTNKVRRFFWEYAEKETQEQRCDNIAEKNWKKVGLPNSVAQINLYDNSHQLDGSSLAEAWESGKRVDPEYPISNSLERVSQEYIDGGEDSDIFKVNKRGALKTGQSGMWSTTMVINNNVTKKIYYCLRNVINYSIDGDESKELLPISFHKEPEGYPDSYPELSTCSSKKDLQKTVSLPPTETEGDGVKKEIGDLGKLVDDILKKDSSKVHTMGRSNSVAAAPANPSMGLGILPTDKPGTSWNYVYTDKVFTVAGAKLGEDLFVPGTATFGTATIKINPEEDTISFGDSSPGIIFGKGSNSEFTFYDAADADDKEGQKSLITIIDTGSTANLDISGGLIVNSGGKSEKMIVNNKNGRAVFSIITDQNLLGMGGRIGFGTDNPTTAIEAVSNKGLAPTFTSYNKEWWVAPGYILRKSLGTEAEPIGVTGKTDDEGRQPEVPGRFMFQVNDRPAGEAASWVDVAMVTSQLDGEVELGDEKRIVPGSLQFWVRSNESDLSTHAMELALYINNQGNLGIGDWIPTVRLEVAQKDEEPQINLTRGDSDRTTSISENDVIGTLAFRGDDKDIVEEAGKLGEKTIVAKISSMAEANFGESESPGALIFSTGNPAAGKSVTERFRIDSGGHITIKPTDPDNMEAGYVLTAINEDGKAEWKEAGGVGQGSSFWSRNDEISSEEYIFPKMTTDKISIGTSTPATYTLDVVGDINIRDDGDDHKNYLLNGELLDVVDGLTAVQEPPASSGISAGEIELFKIKATANTSNDVEVGGAEFNLTLSNLTLEPNSIVVRYDGADLILSANEIAASGGSGKFVFKSPIVISGDESKTFWVYANVQSHQANASMVRSLKGVNGRGVTQWINTAEGISYAKGKVGLGVFDPSYALDVLGDINVSGEFLVNGEAFSGGGDDDWVIDGDNIYRGSGYVGVGTTSPISQLSLATSTAVSGGITFGSDTNFYRSDAKTLKTDGKLIVNSLQIGDSTVNFGSDFLEFDTNPSEIRYNTKLSFKNTANEGKTPVTLDGNNITFNELKDCDVLETDGSGKVLCGEAAGGFTSFNLAGDSGDEQEITDGNKLTIAGGTGIDTKAEDTGKLTISIKANSIDFTHLKDTLTLDGKTLTIKGKSGGTDVNNVFLATGNVEFGGQITIKGGGVGADKVLTSDANGLATWETIDADHDTVTLAGTDVYKYLTLDGQEITLGKLDISVDTNLTVDAPLAITDGKLTITENSIDFTHLKNTLTLDARTVVKLGDKDFDLQLTGTGIFQILKSDNTVLYKFEDGKLTVNGDIDITGKYLVNGQELDTSSAIKVASFEFTFEVHNDSSEKITVDLTGSLPNKSGPENHVLTFSPLKSSGEFDSNDNIIVSPNIVAADIRTSFFNNTIIPEVKSVVATDGKITISLVKKDIGISEYGGAPYGTVKIRVNAFQF